MNIYIDNILGIINSFYGGWMNIFKVILFFFCFFLSLPLHATRNYTVYSMTDLELSQLPPFCQVWGKKDFVATDMWVDKLHIPNIHHLCKGLRHVNRVVTHLGGIHKLRDNIHYGIGEFSYVLSRSTDYNKPLMPFIYVQRAKLHMSSVDLDPKSDIDMHISAAIKDYKEAIKLNPRFERAYVGLIEIYARKKDKDKMIKVLKKGLQYIPKSKLLLKKQKKFDIRM